MKQETDLDFYKTEENYLRSSSIKPFDGCSWLYYCNYVLKIPQIPNIGSLCGNVCHSIFECLLKPRHRRHFNKIIEADSIKGNFRENSVVLELVWKLMKKNNLPTTDEIYNKINDMILTGLKADFFVKGGEIIGSEYRFKYDNISPKYSIFGTMDRIAKKGDKYIIIDDFKSSKQKYVGDDRTANIQALLYSLVATKLWPGRIPIVRFIFLQYPHNPIMEVSFTAQQLKGFEYYLEYISTQTAKFTKENATSNFAADKEIPKSGEFKNKLLCGFNKYKGQLKKDGTLMWGCSYKWPMDYYLIKDSAGKIVYSVLTKEEIKLKEGETIETIHYEGCPRFNNLNNNKFI